MENPRHLKFKTVGRIKEKTPRRKRNQTQNRRFNDIGSAKSNKPAILFITSYPPRECGIATYSQDMIGVLDAKFGDNFQFLICPLETDTERHIYDDAINYTLNTEQDSSYLKTAKYINSDSNIKLICVQHEFGFFHGKEKQFLDFLNALDKPILVTFHTVLPTPSESLKNNVQAIAKIAQSITVMTQSSAALLEKYYNVPQEQIEVIAHGTHLVKYKDREYLKAKYNLSNKKVLSTFGLLGPGKSIETTLNALPGIVSEFPEVVFLIIGKTHPSLKIKEGEVYREFLNEKVKQLNIAENVKFLNRFMPLEELLEYLQLSDIYLFTSKDPNQAVSGTFVYALSCGCPIISTPIPHALEVLKNDMGIVIDFEDAEGLRNEVIRLLKDEQLRKNMSLNGLHRTASTAWENSAISHMHVFDKIMQNRSRLIYGKPSINLDHLKKLTTDFGIIQFSVINHPDVGSGYTLDDNARALIAACKYFELTADDSILPYIRIYVDFIHFCYNEESLFLNYVDINKNFTDQNGEVNLEDSIGRAVWALGYFVSKFQVSNGLSDLIVKSQHILDGLVVYLPDIYSTRAMAFIIKGLYYYNMSHKKEFAVSLIEKLANRLLQMYRHESNIKWRWFEGYLTYGNSVLPDAMLCAYLATNKIEYLETARASFDFLLTKIFRENSIRVISNKNWFTRGDKELWNTLGGEQPIDIAYTILALKRFAETVPSAGYEERMEEAFNWFMGDNHLQEIIYNPCTGGCYDGLEERNVNLNQGAESTLSYLLSRMAFPEGIKTKKQLKQEALQTKKLA